MAVLSLPVILLPSAGLPLAVLRLPAVLLNIALSPVALFRSPVVFTQSESSIGGVEVAFGVAGEGERASGRVFLGNCVV